MVKRLKFDSDLSGLKVGKLTLSGVQDKSSLFKRSIKPYDLIYMFCGADPLLSNYLNDIDFVLADTGVLLKQQLKDLVFKKVGLKSDDFFQAEDEKAVIALGRDLSRESRFYQDPHTRKFGQRVYEQWVKNSILGTEADQILVCRDSQRKVIGFLTVRFQDGVFKPVLVKIDEKHTGQGHGKALFTKFLNFVKKQNSNAVIVVKTQLSNTRSIRFYQSFGLCLADHSFVFHVYPNGFLQIQEKS